MMIPCEWNRDKIILLKVVAYCKQGVSNKFIMEFVFLHRWKKVAFFYIDVGSLWKMKCVVPIRLRIIVHNFLNYKENEYLKKKKDSCQTIIYNCFVLVIISGMFMAVNINQSAQIFVYNKGHKHWLWIIWTVGYHDVRCSFFG